MGKISIVIATYNGSNFFHAQMKSILAYIGKNDEIVISDDNSDTTFVRILNDYMLMDHRIKVVFNKLKGVISNFENGLINTKNEYIFLCDQDDIWFSTKIQKYMEVFYSSDVDLISSGVISFDENLNNETKSLFPKYGFLRNFYSNTFIGHTLAFKRNLLSYFLPFPQLIPMHDHWIILLSHVLNLKIKIIKEPLAFYRRHTNAVTFNKKTSIFSKIKSRAYLIWVLFQRFLEVR